MTSEAQQWRPFTCELEPHRETLVVRAGGELDLASANEFERMSDEACAAGFERVVLDLRELTFLDSTGLRGVLRLYAKVETRFEIIRGPSAVQHVFEITGMDTELPFTSAQAALE